MVRCFWFALSIVGISSLWPEQVLRLFCEGYLLDRNAASLRCCGVVGRGSSSQSASSGHHFSRTTPSSYRSSSSSLLCSASTPLALVAEATTQHEDATTISIVDAAPRLWLESEEDGAYTVLRCDYCDDDGGGWKVWGRDFHLQRLQESFKVVLIEEDCDDDNVDFDRATEQTLSLIDRLLAAAEEKHATIAPPSHCRTVFMVTILWQRPRVATSSPAVLGHICRGMSTTIDSGGRDGSPVERDNFPFASYNPQPLTVAVAVSCGDGDKSLPNRKPNPQAKLSSWCSQRRPLEEQFQQDQQELVVKCVHGKDIEQFEPVVVNEVILVDNDDKKRSSNGSKVRLLEGLTSNLFVVYPKKVIRTAGQGVLEGYARHLVLQQVVALASANWTDDDDWSVDTTTPICLEDAAQWEQVFVTSSIRIIAPVNRVLVPIISASSSLGENDDEAKSAVAPLQEVWSMDNKRRRRENDRESLAWRQLYEAIVRHQYSSQY